MRDRFALQARRLRDRFSGPNHTASLGALVATAVLLALWWQVGRWYQAQLSKEKRSALAADISLQANALSSAVNRPLVRLDALDAFVQAEIQAAEVSEMADAWPEFETFAASLYSGSTGIRNLAVAPGDVVRYVYPPAGNEAVPGYEPLNDLRPDVWAAVQQAIAPQEVMLYGPLELVQGGIGLIAQQAVYLDGKYWGFVNMVLDLPLVLDQAGMDEFSSNVDIVLRDSNGQVLYGSDDVLGSGPVISRIALPGGDWELAGVPSTGWTGAIRKPLLVFQVAGLIIVGFLTGLTYLSINHQARLSQAVRERTRELQKDITERKRVEAALREREALRTQELTTLLVLSNQLVSTLEMQPLMQLILEQLKQVVNYTGATVLILEGNHLQAAGHHGPVSMEAIDQIRLPLESVEEFWAAMLRREPLIVDDVRADTSLAESYRQVTKTYPEAVTSYVRAWMGIPLMVQERLIGALSINHDQPGTYTYRHAVLAMAIANQAAIAIENARLYEQARRLAVLEERQRLARELHDSVSQALYGIGMGASTARALLERDPSQAVEPLDYVISLTEAALAEMRALIFELRPDSLEKEGLVAALAKQAAALRARHHLEVHTEFCDEPTASFEAKEALYRIAQEALNNTVKHARASRVEIRLDDSNGVITLEVKDDGIGFDPQGEYPGHLGLGSMRERAARLGGTLETKSTPGNGTRVRVCVLHT
jgi:signal transduction histidine kinase